MEIMIHEERIWELAISNFTEEKGPITSHENTLYRAGSVIGMNFGQISARLTGMEFMKQNQYGTWNINMYRSRL